MLSLNLLLAGVYRFLLVCRSAKSLLKLAQMAEELPGSGPKDLSENLDKYAWDLP